MDLDLFFFVCLFFFCGHVIDLICFLEKAFILFCSLTESIHFLKNGLIITKQLSFEWNQKLLQVSMYIFVLIVEIVINITLFYVNEKQSHIMNKLTCFSYVEFK